MSSIVEVETLNGTEFVNLDLVRRFVPGDDSLELRFGQAETLVLTGDSAQRVLKWVTAQAQALGQQTATSKAPQTPPATRQPEKKTKPQRRIQLMPLNTTVHLSLVPTPHPPSAPTLDSIAASVLPTRPLSPTIDRQHWLP